MKPSVDASFWGSKLNVLLLNPRLPEGERRVYETAWIREQGRRSGQGLGRKEGLIALATSGTSGQLKLVLLSRSSLLASAASVNRHLNVVTSDVWLKTLPDFHVGGLSILARASLSGSRVVSTAATGSGLWAPDAFRTRAEETGATLISLVPAQVFDLVKAGLRAPASLRAVIVGGGAMSNELYVEARRLGWPCLPSYGLTECGSQVATASLETVAAKDIPLKAPHPRLLDHVKARVGEGARLEIRSDALLDGYLRIDGDESAYVDPKVEGWFRTDDRVTLHGSDSPGGITLEIHGRGGDFIKIGGESVDFARLESRFEALKLERAKQGQSFPDCAVIAVPDERLGRAIHLIHDGDSAAAETGPLRELIDAFDQSVAPFERVRWSHAVARVPRSPLGKLLRSEALALIGFQSLADS